MGPISAKIALYLTVFKINDIFHFQNSEKSKCFIEGTCTYLLKMSIIKRFNFLLMRKSLGVNSNSNSNSTFIALNLCQKTDSKAHHTKTLFNIQKSETLQGSAPRRKQKEIGNLGWV